MAIIVWVLVVPVVAVVVLIAVLALWADVVIPQIARRTAAKNGLQYTAKSYGAPEGTLPEWTQSKGAHLRYQMTADDGSTVFTLNSQEPRASGKGDASVGRTYATAPLAVAVSGASLHYVAGGEGDAVAAGGDLRDDVGSPELVEAFDIRAADPKRLGSLLTPEVERHLLGGFGYDQMLAVHLRDGQVIAARRPLGPRQFAEFLGWVTQLRDLLDAAAR